MSAGKKSASQPVRSEQATDSASAASAPATVSQRFGNQYLQMLLHTRQLQAKLSVSDPRDSYEQEADRVADRVMRMAEPTAPVSAIQRLTPDSPSSLSRASETAGSGPAVDPETEDSIRGLAGRGSALPESVRSFMEPRFNADFSAVRVHTDAGAHALARAVNAQAFTVGRHVVFGAGRYAPEIESGRRLLAHELTHVVQQGASSPAAAGVVQREVDPDSKFPTQPPEEHRSAHSVTWYVEMDPATPIVAKGTTVTFRLRNSQGHHFGWSKDVVEGAGHLPVFMLTDSQFHVKAWKPRLVDRNDSHMMYKTTLDKPGKYRATFFGRPTKAETSSTMGQTLSSREDGEIRVSVDFDVVADVSSKTVGSGDVVATGIRDMHHLEAPETAPGEIAGAFQRLAVRRAFQVLEDNRKEALEQLALYNGNAQLTDQLASIVALDDALVREATPWHNSDDVRARAEKAGRRADPLAYQREQLQRISDLRAALMEAFPALALVSRDVSSGSHGIRHDSEPQWTFRNKPNDRTAVIRAGLQRVLGDIETAKEQLANGKLSIMDAKPILAETRTQLGIDGNPRASKAIDDLFKEHGVKEAKLGMIVGGVSLLLLLVPGIGPYLTAAVGIGWAARSWKHAGSMGTAAGAGLRRGIVAPADAAAAGFWAVLDTVFAAADLGVAAAHALSVARKVAPHIPEAAARLTGRTAREAAAATREGKLAFEGLPRSGAAGSVAEEPFVLSEAELQDFASRLFEQDVPNLTDRVHFYPTEQEYQIVSDRLQKKTNGRYGPGWYDPQNGNIHLSPTAGVRSVIHETVHKVADDALPMGRDLIGAFLDEGITEAITRSRLGPHIGTHVYDTHVAFVEALQKQIGTKIVENVVLKGEYRTFRDAIKQLFGGSEELTFKFMTKLREIATAESTLGNPRALEEASEMLRGVVRKPAAVPAAAPRSAKPHPAGMAPAGPDAQTTRLKIQRPAEERGPRSIERPDSVAVAGEIDAPDVARPHRGKVTTGPKVVVVDPAIAERARTSIRELLHRLLRTGELGSITAERVGLTGVQVIMDKERQLTVLYDIIVNVDRIPGRGSVVHGALEQAAIDVARESRAKAVRVAVRLVQNPQLLDDLVRLGYRQGIVAFGEDTFWSALIRRLPL